MWTQLYDCTNATLHWLENINIKSIMGQTQRSWVFSTIILRLTFQVNQTGFYLQHSALNTYVTACGRTTTPPVHRLGRRGDSAAITDQSIPVSRRFSLSPFYRTSPS